MSIKTNGKFIIQLTGPFLKYRLDILAEACPEARHFLLCLTNKDSYELYKDYHGFFEFIIMDDYRKDYPISLKYEIFPNYKTEEEFCSKITSFYNESTGNFYSYDIHRFIFPYLIENNILNFTIIDTDFILINDFNILNEYFNNIPVKTCYGPWFGEDLRERDIKTKFWKEEIQPYFPQINLQADFIRDLDGFTRGFHFNNLEDMKLLYNLWNKALETLFINKFYNKFLVGNNRVVLHTEWVISHIIQFFKYQLNYNFEDCYSFFTVNNKSIGRHKTRVEDTFYLGPRTSWEQYNFDYSNTSSISNFIKNNKNSLKLYYNNHFENFEITDTHIYTRIN
jgi:hypothetical protein